MRREQQIQPSQRMNGGFINHNQNMPKYYNDPYNKVQRNLYTEETDKNYDYPDYYANNRNQIQKQDYRRYENHPLPMHPHMGNVKYNNYVDVNPKRMPFGNVEMDRYNKGPRKDPINYHMQCNVPIKPNVPYGYDLHQNFHGNPHMMNQMPNRDNNIGKTVGDYLLTKKLGKGQFATVYLATKKNSDKEYAVKTINKSKVKSTCMQNLLKTEIAIMKQFDHPSIMKLYDILESTNNYYLTMNICNNGDMLSYMKKRGINHFSEIEALHYLKQIAVAFRELHKKKVMHRDFKLANLFMHDDKVIIGDFGMSKKAVELTKTQCGTGVYMAPEILNGRPYTNKADLWSVGVSFYEMLFGKVPFDGNGTRQLERLIRQCSGPNLKFPLHINKISEKCQSLLREMLNEDPKKRIQWSEFFNHDIFSNIQLEQYEKKKSKNPIEKDFKNRKMVEESFKKCAFEIKNQKAEDEIFLKDPESIAAIEATEEKVQNVEEGKIDDITMNTIEKKVKDDEKLEELFDKYAHERHKCHFIAKAVKNLRNVYKSLIDHKLASSMIITYLQLLKKTITYEEYQYNSLKKQKNELKVDKDLFKQFLETSKYKELTQIYKHEINNLYKSLAHLTDFTTPIDFPKEELILIKSLSKEKIDMSVIQKLLDKKITVLKKLLDDEKIKKNKELEKQVCYSLFFAYYSYKCDKAFEFKDDMKFSWNSFYKKIESYNGEKQKQFVCKKIKIE